MFVHWLKGGITVTRTAERPPIGAIELIAFIGFSLSFGWVLMACFWIPSLAVGNISSASLGLAHGFVFAGIPFSYALQHLFAKRAAYTPFDLRAYLAIAALAALACSTFVAAQAGIGTAQVALCIACFIVGVVTSFVVTTWLHLSSQLTVKHYVTYVGGALTTGCALFALSGAVIAPCQPILAFACLAASLAVQYALAFRIELPPAERKSSPLTDDEIQGTWSNLLEIEPSFFVFGIVFGVAFHCILDGGWMLRYLGILAIALGAAILTAVSAKGWRINITFVQRFLLCICVVFCMAFQFFPSIVTAVAAALAAAGWAAFLATNYAFMIKKGLLGPEPPYRQIPIRLVLSNTGFFLGWLVFSGIDLVSDAFGNVRLVIGIALALAAVIVFMLFYPDRRHHRDDGTSHNRSLSRHAAPKAAAPAPACPDVHDAAEPNSAYRSRCRALGELYGLSPREIQVLECLARGRNATYIRKELFISQNTAKSHIHKIYEKFDIHSQQKLMDFIESYPLDSPSSREGGGTSS